MSEKISWFDIVKDITFEKKRILGEWDMSSYVPFLVNKALMQNNDTIHFASEMNKLANLPSDLQYDFLMVLVPKRKRYGKWAKAVVSDDIDAIKEVYGVSRKVAQQYLRCLKPEDLVDVNRRRNAGKRVKNNNDKKRGKQSS